MTEMPQQRRGWCPSVWSPMASGDGIIVRVHTGGRPLGMEAARLLGALARQYGNGLIDVTRRANLQLRGLTEDTLAKVQAQLVTAGLAPSSRDRERQLHVLVSPRAGLDFHCAPVEELYHALRDGLLALRPIANLSAKFSILIDGDDGDLTPVSCDVRVRVSVRAPETACISVHDGSEEASLGMVPRERVVEVVCGLLERLGRIPSANVRMRDLVAREGLSAWRAAFGVTPSELPPPSPSRPWLGVHAGVRAWLGVAAPFGSLHVRAWQTLVDLAESLGAQELRVHPARGFLLPDVPVARGREAVAALRAAGFMVAEDDPRHYVVACGGAPRCQSAFGETHALARRLASQIARDLGPSRLLHVSGCAKSCAYSGKAAFTVVLDEVGAKLALDASVAEAVHVPRVSLAQLSHALLAQRNERVRQANPRAQDARDEAP